MQLTDNLHWKTLHGLKSILLGKPRHSCLQAMQACGLHLDASSQRISTVVLEELIQLAQTSELKTHIARLFSGQQVNTNEKRPALHMALRDPRAFGLPTSDGDALEKIHKCQQSLYIIAEKIRKGEWLGYNGKPIKHIVNIGIGGSDFGPKFCTHALKALHHKHLSYHFISDSDPFSFDSVCTLLNPEETLFILASKSFTTPETFYNFSKAQAWLGAPIHWSQHFIAVTANTELAINKGFKNILPIWSWVGGRFSITSAINLITTIAIGPEAFKEFLCGAHAMDQHFQHTAWPENIPVMLALIGIWNINFLEAHQHIILNYGQALNPFVRYIQQLDMESNGKSVTLQGKKVNYATGPVVWGGPGNQAQHSYYQLLCQGTHKFAIDMISLKNNDSQMINQMCNQTKKVLFHGVPNPNHKHDQIKGGVPINHIELKHLSPYTLGALVAMYEHKIFTQSVIWQINPFDQPGVESAKKYLLKPAVNQVI